MTADSEYRALRDYYDLGLERDRLASARGVLEFERTKELILRHLPPPSAVVADIGGGPGRYSVWLAEIGYQVVHRDLTPLHVEQLANDGRGHDIDSAVGDARELDLATASVDAVLLLGPLYHLRTRRDRVLALVEASRVVHPGGMVFASAISRWAPRLDGILASRLYRQVPEFLTEIDRIERTGRMSPLFTGDFNGFGHRPGQLRSEVRAAGLELVSLLTIEGLALYLPDLEARLADPVDRQVVFDAARATESAPELLGVGPHLLATARSRT